MSKLLTLILWGCFLSMAAYGQSVLELSNKEPKAGTAVHFTYKGPLSRTLLPEFRIYFYSRGPLKWTTISGKRDKDQLIGEFSLPSGVLAFCIRPDKYKDVKEAFSFSVFEKDEPVAGARAGMAQFQNNLRSYTYLKDSLKAIALFREEFEAHPELKAKYLLEYFRNGSYGTGSLGTEMQAVWADSLKLGRDDGFLFQLYSFIKDDKTVDGSTKARLREDILRRFPKGELALKEDPNQARRSDLSGLKMLEMQYPELVASGKLDNYYGYAVRLEVNKGNYAEADHYLRMVRSLEWGEGLCRFASAHLLNKGLHLDWAADYCEMAIAFLDSMPMSDGYATEQEWKNQQNYLKSIYYYDRIAQIRYKQGRLKDAIAAAALGDNVNSIDTEPKERYLTYLMEDGQYGEVVKSASSYVLTHHSSEQIEALLKDAYLRQGFSESAYRIYRTGLDREQQLVYKPRGTELSGVKAIDFSLQDIAGHTVSLKDYRGNYVVLYFFVPSADSWTECEDYMVRKVDSLSSVTKIKFIGINETIVLTSDIVRATELRRKIAQDFFKKAGVSFPLLLDTYIYNPDIYWSDRYLDVSSDYGARRGGGFFIIDKKGNVRYKSSSGAFVSVETLKTEFSAALKLVNL